MPPEGRTFLRLFLLIIVVFISLTKGSAHIPDSAPNKARIDYRMELYGTGAETLTIATYESLMAWGYAEVDGTEIGIKWDDVEDAVFTKFGNDHGVTVELRKFADAGEMLQAAIQEKDSLSVDVLIGLDNILAQDGIEEGLFQKYQPDNISEVIAPRVIAGLDRSGYLTPYDYGLIALVQHKGTVDLGESFTLQSIIDQGLANRLITQNPVTSSTGLGFLMWTISVYEKILNQSWEDWWKAVASDIRVTKGWGDAWALWDQGEGDLLVSYATDPAYSNYFWESTGIEAYVSHEAGSGNATGWVQIEGLGITKAATGTKLTAAKSFVDWFISEEVQQLIPTTNWMFPANQHVDLPPAFQYAIHPDNVSLLNDLWTPSEIKTRLGPLRDTWEEIMVFGTETESPSSFGWLALFSFGVVVIARKAVHRKSSTWRG